MSKVSNAVSVVVVGGTALAQRAQTLTSGTFAQMSPTPSGLLLFVRAGGLWTGGASGLSIAYCHKFARDASGKKFYFMGSDHNGQAIFLQYNESTNAWTQAAANPFGAGQSGGAPDHGYDHTVFEPSAGKLWHRPYGGTRALRRWDGGTTWGTVDYSSAVGYPASTTGLAWFPEMGAFVLHQVENVTNGSLVKVTTAGVVTTLINGDSSSTLSGSGDPHCFCVYSAARQLVYFGGGNGGAHIWTVNASGTVTLKDNPPSGVSSPGPSGPGAHHATINPANGNLVLIGGPSTWYELNPAASLGSQWTAKGYTFSPLSANTSGDGGAYGMMCCPVEEYGVVCFVKNYSSTSPAEMWLWKP